LLFLFTNQVLCEAPVRPVALDIVALKGQIATEMLLVLGTLTVTVAVTVSRQPLDRSLAENTAS